MRISASLESDSCKTSNKLGAQSQLRGKNMANEAKTTSVYDWPNSVPTEDAK
jgi:hypothetical protein